MEGMDGLKHVEAHLLHVSYAIIMGVFAIGVIIAIIDDVYSENKDRLAKLHTEAPVQVREWEEWEAAWMCQASRCGGWWPCVQNRCIGM